MRPRPTAPRVQGALALCVGLVAAGSNPAAAQHDGHAQDARHHHGPLPAQQVDSARLAEFASTARAATARFHSLESAIEAGYRRIGPEFPGMGEHWVQPGLLVAGRFEPARPPILNYIRVGGRAVLAGVAYAVPLVAGGTPPDFPDVEAWHDHSGTVDEESFLVGHGHVNAHHVGARAPARLAMLHAWIWMENPDGLFAQHNWALPYLRIGVPVPPEAPMHAPAARAVSLRSGGDAYYALLLARVLDSSADLPVAIRMALDDAYAAVGETLARDGTPDASRLAAIWLRLVDRLVAAAPEHGTRIQELLR